jgi:hypothetical protein
MPSYSREMGLRFEFSMAAPTTIGSTRISTLFFRMPNKFPYQEPNGNKPNNGDDNILYG